jgi:uncharacterized membrane protein
MSIAEIKSGVKNIVKPLVILVGCLYLYHFIWLILTMDSFTFQVMGMSYFFATVSLTLQYIGWTMAVVLLVESIVLISLVRFLFRHKSTSFTRILKPVIYSYIGYLLYLLIFEILVHNERSYLLAEWYGFIPLLLMKYGVFFTLYSQVSHPNQTLESLSA